MFLEILIGIILLPIAAAAIGFTVCLAVGLVKGIMKLVKEKI